MFKRGNLVLVPYPFTDLSASKRRPVLALTPPDGFGDFIGLPVTSKGGHANSVAIAQADMAEGKLPAPSWIRTDRIVTLSKSLVVKGIGRIADRVVDEAVTKFCATIGYKR